jgi:hypothetical protein
MAKRPENPTPKKQLQRARVRQLIKIEKMYNAALEGYARELGLLIHSWNDLHIELTQLFLVVCRDYQLEEERDILLAVWNAIPNERLQREMLRQAARVRYSLNVGVMTKIGIDIEPIRTHDAAILNEILWVLEKADSLGRKRDDSTHVPMILDATMPFSLRPRAFDGLGHPIAKQLSDKELLEEFSLYRARILAVSTHASAVLAYLIGGDEPSLPERPLWPSSPPSSAQKDGKEPKRAKQRFHQPRASRT